MFFSGGLVFINKKAAFDSDYARELEEVMDPTEKEELNEINSIRRTHAIQQHESYILDNTVCLHDGCDFNIAKTKRYCQLHEKRAIIALDWNNLYGSIMQQAMPCEDFQNLDTDELNKFQCVYDRVYSGKSTDEDNRLFSPDNERGYIFVAKVEYPDSMHEKVKQFPPATDNIVIEYEMLSEQQKKHFKEVYGTKKTCSPQKKMVHAFYTKDEYTAHMQTLHTYAKLGCKLTLIRGYSFVQHKIAKAYVQMCAKRRGEATNDADVMLYKNFCNIIFGVSKYYNLFCNNLFIFSEIY